MYPHETPPLRRLRGPGSGRIGLRGALALRVLAPLFVVLGTAVWLGLGALDAEVERRMKDEVDLVARALRLSVTHAMVRERDGGVREALRSALRIGRVYGAYVYDSDGALLVAQGPTAPDESPERVVEMVEVGTRVGEFGAVGGRPVYSAFVPLVDEWGRSLGLLQVVRRQADFEDYAVRLRVGAFAALVLGLGVVTLLVLHGHHGAAVAPLRRLRDSMARVGAGEQEHRAATDGPKELADVAVTFNAMLDGLQATTTELDRRRRAQEKLGRELASAEKLAAVGELASGVAHELGTPLSIVDGHAHRLSRSEGLPATTRQRLDAVRTQVSRMEGIIRQLIELGRDASGRRRRVQLDALVRGAADAVADAADCSGVRLELRPPTHPVRVDADARRLEEAILHLLRNALQAAPGGRVRISWKRSGAAVALEVEDDGSGVPDELRARIFEPFYTTKAHGEGAGLGLAVVHGTVEDHGGRIVADRSPLGGARFSVSLPAPLGIDEEMGATKHEP